MKVSPLNILPAFKFRAQAVQKFHFLFTHNSLLGIPPNKMAMWMILHVCVVAATVNRKVKPREWKWMFWFPHIVKSALCTELFSIWIINNTFNYLTCAQYKENVNEFICESQKWQSGKVASHQVKTRQTTVLFLKELRWFKFPPQILVFNKAAIRRNKVYQQTVELAFILHSRLVLIDHCAIVWFDCADSYMPLFP